MYMLLLLLAVRVNAEFTKEFGSQNEEPYIILHCSKEITGGGLPPSSIEIKNKLISLKASSNRK